MLFFNSRINTYYKQDLFQTLSINDQVYDNQVTVDQINLTQKRLFFELGLPQVSPNILKHYPTADYLRYTYEIYQIPPLSEFESLISPQSSDPEASALSERKKIKEEHLRAMKYFCKITEYTHSDQHSDLGKIQLVKPLLSTSIIYKKGDIEKRILHAEIHDHRNLGGANQGANKNQKFRAEYFLQSNSELANVRVDLNLPGSDKNAEFNSNSYTITNHLDIRKLFVPSSSSSSKKDAMVNFDVSSMKNLDSTHPQKFKFFISQKIEILEDDWYGSEQQDGLKYGSFVLNPKVIELDLSAVKLIGSLDPIEKQPKSDNFQNSGKANSGTDEEGKSSSGENLKPDYDPLKTKEKNSAKDTLKTVAELLAKELNKQDKKKKSADFAPSEIFEDALVKSLCIVGIILLLFLCACIICGKRKMERDGYYSSNQSGEFENEVNGTQTNSGTGRSIEVTDHVARTQDSTGEFEMSQLSRNPKLKDDENRHDKIDDTLGYSIE